MRTLIALRIPEPAERVVPRTTTSLAIASSTSSEMRRERRVQNVVRVIGIAIEPTSFRVVGPRFEPLRRR
jgi:hypothetical protein